MQLEKGSNYVVSMYVREKPWAVVMTPAEVAVTNVWHNPETGRWNGVGRLTDSPFVVVHIDEMDVLAPQEMIA